MGTRGNYLVLDTEFTVGSWLKGEGGDPFDPKNKLCLVGCLTDDNLVQTYKVEYDDSPFGDALAAIQQQVDSVDLLILFNAKRDLHWLRRYGIQFQNKRIWDVQLAHFILGGQEEPYPSLNGVSEYYKLGQKIDVIYEKYLSKKIDIDEVPLDELVPYLHQDLYLTRDCYSKQLNDPRLNESNHRLIVLTNIDLLILQEMEWNGIVYDVQESKKRAETIREEISLLDASINDLVGGVPVNWNSGDHVSCILYGGTISVDRRVENGVFLTGKKAGQTKYRIEKEEYKFPRIVTPLKKSELAKDGFWATSEPVLQQLKAYGKAARIIDCLLKRAKLEKLVSSYFEGLPKIMASHGWGTTIHGTLNQCVAATGRLSSSKPNLQNNSKEVEKLFRSRYE